MKTFQVCINILLLTLLLQGCRESSVKSDSSIESPVSNVAPTANAGEDQTVRESSEVFLQGTGTDTDGSIVSYTWVETSGYGVVISNSESATLMFDAPSIATQLTLNFELTVTDNMGGTATDIVSVIIEPVLVSQTVVAGEELTLSLDSAELVIPADTIDDGVEVTLSIVELESLADSPIGPGETLISPIYELTFTATKIVNKSLVFSFNYPEELELEDLYTRIKIEGGLFTEGVIDNDWSIVFDKVASPIEQMSIELYSTASKYLIVGIDSGRKTKSKAQVSQLSNAISKSNDIVILPGQVYRPALADHGWIIACDPKIFADTSSDACDPSHPDYELMLNSLGEQLYKSDKMLTTLGFPTAETRIITGGGTTRHIIYDPDDRSRTTNVTFQKPDNSFLTTNLYHLAWVSPSNEDTLGVYDINTKSLTVNAFEGDDTAIHELMHAVQNYEIPTVWHVNNDMWITEGLAEAVVPFSEADTSISTDEYRNFGVWRDWTNKLSSTGSNQEYQVTEFWLSTLDNSLHPLPDFYHNFSSKGPFVHEAGLAAVDEAMIESGLPSLGDAYRELILSRNSDPRYPYCESVTPVCEDNSCEIPVSVSSVSASCFDVEVSFESCESEENILVSLEKASGSEPDSHLEMILDGIIYPSNTEVDFSQEGRIWAINTGYSAENSTSNAVITFKNQTNCYVKLLKQYLHSRAYANADKVFSFVEPAKDISDQIYSSVEDLSTSSLIGNYHLGSIEQKAGYVYSTIEPLGLEPYESAHSAHAMSKFPEDASTDEAFATSYLYTDTDSDSTSMTTFGEHMAAASIVVQPVSAQASNISEYQYSIGSRSVTLSLTWACSITQVIITTEDTNGIQETLFKADNVQNDVTPWECGTKTWTISPDTKLTVYIKTINYVEAAGVNDFFRETGGEFEISIEAIL